MKLLGESIRALRRKNGLTQQQLALLIDVHRHHISRWEKGHNMPKTKNIETLCKVLNVTERELFTFKDSNGPLDIAIARLHLLSEAQQLKVLALIAELWESQQKDQRTE